MIVFTPHKKPMRGFTLIELMAATTVLAILGLVLVQITGATSETSRRDTRSTGASSEARSVFDSLGRDLVTRVRLPGLPAAVKSPAGNDSVELLSRARGFDGDRPASSISYKIADDGTKVRLERAALGMDWVPGPKSLTFPVTLPPPAVADFQPISDAVIRLEICGLFSDGFIKAQPTFDLEDPTLQALIVSVVVLDERGRKALSPAQISALPVKFANAVNTGIPLRCEIPARIWRNFLLSEDLASSGLPGDLKNSLHIFQRTYDLH